MQRDRIGKIVAIGNGLCRVIVRSERKARQLAEIPDVQIIDQTADNLGWWLIFPERIRKILEPAFREETKTIVTRRIVEPEQMSLLEELEEREAFQDDSYDEESSESSDTDEASSDSKDEGERDGENPPG